MFDEVCLSNQLVSTSYWKAKEFKNQEFLSEVAFI